MGVPKEREVFQFMTFKRFEEIVKGKYPEAELFAHGEFSVNKINVAVVFDPYGKVYKYNGTYCDVLNRLGIKAIYKHDIENYRAMIEMFKRIHGTKGFFGDTIDKTEDIEKYEAEIADFEKNYIIV